MKLVKIKKLKEAMKIVIKKNTIGPRKDDDLDKYTFESLWKVLK